MLIHNGDDMHGKTEEYSGQLCLQSTQLNVDTFRDTMEKFFKKTKKKVVFVALALFSHSQPPLAVRKPSCPVRAN